MSIFTKNLFNKEIVVQFLFLIIFLKNIFSGVNLSTDFIERYDFAVLILDEGIKNSGFVQFYKLSAFDWLHFGYILICFVFKSIFGSGYYVEIIIFQSILCGYSIFLCLKYLRDLDRKILFLIYSNGITRLIQIVIIKSSNWCRV